MWNITSSVDWCEDNFAVLPFVAEFWNTTSSLALCAVAVFGQLLHRRLNVWYSNAVFATLFVVGLGSVAFHSRLTSTCQLFDEVPMVVLVCLLMYVVTLDPDWKTVVWTSFSGSTMVLAMTKTMTASSSSGPGLEFYVFQTSFVLFVMWGLGRFMLTLRRFPMSLSAHLLLQKGLGIFLLGWGCWLVDYFGCGWVQGLSWNPQLHAWWHVLSAVGTYHLCVFACLVKLNRTRGYDYDVETLYKTLPVVTLRKKIV